MATYGQTIHWTGWDFESTVSVQGCSSSEEAFSEAVLTAKAMGWTPPRWWQWWRWSERVRSETRRLP